MGILRVALLVTLVAAALGASASAHATPANVDACGGQGWQTVGTTDKQLFRNMGECVAYSARGGTLVPLLQAVADERCLIDPLDPPNSVCVTVTGFGLEPESAVTVTLVFGEPIVYFATVDLQGEVFFQTAAGCLPGTEEIVLSLYASGTTASGLPLTTPTDTFSVFCTQA